MRSFADTEGREDRKVLLSALKAGFEEAISGAENSSGRKQTFPDCLFLLLGRTPLASAMLLFPQHTVVPAMHWVPPLCTALLHRAAILPGRVNTSSDFACFLQTFG